MAARGEGGEAGVGGRGRGGGGTEPLHPGELAATAGLQHIMADDAFATTPARVGQVELFEKAVARDVIVEDTVVNIGGSEVKSSELHSGEPKEELGSEGDILEIESKIHRFPAELRRFGTERDYIAPRTVALGPYTTRIHELPYGLKFSPTKFLASQRKLGFPTKC
ncbi:hypothetical protein ACP70R_008540 [Stipagrostis hirtigluma subsp. patula]